MAAEFNDLAEHASTLVVLIGVGLVICGTLIGVIWKIMTTIALTMKTDILELVNKVDDRVSVAFQVMEDRRKEQELINAKFRERQETLREELPEKYLRVQGPGYKILVDGIDGIKENFEQFAKDCREGHCLGAAKKAS